MNRLTMEEVVRYDRTKDGLHSFWSVSYTGPHYGVFIKRLQRLSGLHPEHIQKQRIIFDGNKIKNCSFFVHHQAQSWPELVLEVLDIAWTISPVWNIYSSSKNFRKHLTGSAPKSSIHPTLTDIWSISFDINEMQAWRRFLWSSEDQW